MHDVKKFFVCAFLGLVIFTPTCFAAMTCDEQVKFSAIFKWSDGEVDMITSDIDRKIADDTEVYDAAKARIDVLADMFTKQLQQTKKFKCRESKTCEAGQTLKECSPTLARCFAEIVAQDEYIANLQNRLCNSGINLDRRNDSIRELITSYTPLQLSATTGGGSTPAPASPPTARSNTPGDNLTNDTQMINDQTNKAAGRGNRSRDSKSQPIERMQNKPAAMTLGDERGDFIKNQTREVQLGRKLSFTAEDKTKYSNDLQSWRTACESYATTNISTDIAKTYIKETSDKKQTKFEWTCLIEKCQDQQNLSGKVKKMEPTPDGRGCMETNGKSCIPSDKHAEFGQFNEEKNICEVRTCKEDYTLTPDGKCEKTKKLERQAAKATTKLEKDFVSDITKLSDAFDKVVKKLTKECEKSGGTIKNGVCENAQTTDQQSKASNNRRGSGSKRR